jgi:hypothetical protein
MRTGVRNVNIRGKPEKSPKKLLRRNIRQSEVIAFKALKESTASILIGLLAIIKERYPHMNINTFEGLKSIIVQAGSDGFISYEEAHILINLLTLREV